MTTRLVRKQSLQSRIANFPVDTYYAIHEAWETIEWSKFEWKLSIPAGIASNVLLYIARTHRPTGNEVLISRRAHRSPTVYYFGFLLMALALANSYICFFTQKPYRLFATPLDAPPATPSARRVTMDDASSSPLRRLLAPVLPSLRVEDSSRQVWEVAMWSAPPLSLTFFCFYSPLHAFFLWTNPSWLTILLNLLLSLQFLYLVHAFQTLQKDKSVIYGQVLNEYDAKFVRPKTSVQMRNVSTSTDGTVRASTPVASRIETPLHNTSPLKSYNGPPSLYGGMSKSHTMSSLASASSPRKATMPGAHPFLNRTSTVGSTRDYIPSPLAKRQRKGDRYVD